MALTEEQLKLQMEILASKTDSSTNPNMVYKTSAILNKALNPEYFSGNYTKIVNALNQLAESLKKVESGSNNVNKKVNDILLDTSDYDNQLIWERLQDKMGQPTIIQGLLDFFNGDQNDKIFNFTNEDIGKILTVDLDEEGRFIFKTTEGTLDSDNNVTPENLLYENRFVPEIQNVKAALDYLINEVENNDFDGGLGGGTIVGDITWEMIENKPTIANNIMLTQDSLELRNGTSVVSSVPLTSSSDIEEIMDSLLEEQTE